MTSLKFYISPVREKLETSNLDSRLKNFIGSVPLGTTPQAVLMTLAHNHFTNLYLELQRGYCY